MNYLNNEPFAKHRLHTVQDGLRSMVGASQKGAQALRVLPRF